jgi:hypothetical protein
MADDHTSQAIGAYGGRLHGDQGFFLGEHDLKNDPGEMVNRYHDPACQPVIKRMKKQLREVREQLGETDTKYPAIQKIIADHWDR